MKRYEPTFSSRWYPTMQEGEADEGEWVLYRDVLKETIPRPSPEAVSKAVDLVIEKAMKVQHSDSFGPNRTYLTTRESLKKAKDELLRLMGVE